MSEGGCDVCNIRAMTAKSAVWALVVLAFCSNILFMSGLASLQYACNAGYVDPIMERLRVPAAFGLSDTWAHCGSLFRFFWFAFAFMTVTLCGLAIAASTRTGLHYSRPFWVGMVTVCVFLMMVACEAFLGYEPLYEQTWWLYRFRATVAGAIINAVWLVFLLLAVGTDWERTASGHAAEAGKEVPARAPVGAAAGLP